MKSLAPATKNSAPSLCAGAVAFAALLAWLFSFVSGRAHLPQTELAMTGFATALLARRFHFL